MDNDFMTTQIQPHSEARIQADSYQWFYNTYPHLRGLIFSVPNGGTRNMREALVLKATGVTPGVPDLLLLYPSPPHIRPIGIEFKTPTSAVSPAQTKLHDTWRKNGIEVYVVRSVEEFKSVITKIITQS